MVSVAPMWPAWMDRWYGIVLRLIVGVGGVLVGLGLLWLANFGASFKRDVPQWDLESVLILLAGLVPIGSSLVAAFRRSKGM